MWRYRRKLKINYMAVMKLKINRELIVYLPKKNMYE